MENNNILPIILDILDQKEFSAKMDAESQKREIEVTLKKREIAKKYASKIQQMPQNGLFWIRFQGKVVKRTTKEGVLEKIYEIEKEETQTINTLWVAFAEHRRLSCSGGTFGKDVYNYEHFIKNERIAEIPLSKITFSNCESWAKRVLQIKSDNITDKYFKNVKGTLSVMFQYAMKEGLMDKNPVAEVSVHKDNLTPKKLTRDEDRFFSEKEEDIVVFLAFQEAETTNDGLPLGIPLLFQVGIRDGELCALHWRDVEGQYLHIQSEMVETRNERGQSTGFKYVSHCKTKAGDRWIKLTSEAISILAKVKEYNVKNGFGVSKDDYIFQRYYKGKPTHATTRCFEPRLKRYCREANMSVLKSQHDIRRTFATRLFYAGMNMKSLAKIMGHESTSQTEKYVMGYCSEGDEALMEVLCHGNSKSEQIGTDLRRNKKSGNTEFISISATQKNVR